MLNNYKKKVKIYNVYLSLYLILKNKYVVISNKCKDYH